MSAVKYHHVIHEYLPPFTRDVKLVDYSAYVTGFKDVHPDVLFLELLTDLSLDKIDFMDPLLSIINYSLIRRIKEHKLAGSKRVGFNIVTEPDKYHAAIITTGTKEYIIPAEHLPLLLERLLENRYGGLDEWSGIVNITPSGWQLVI